ncbi:GNAT family N-acetyltransferase [Sphingorhabdus sp.]|jgi:RimJ/RimL family protein N-acetyltransferase|uniref:GNAT family N-acetyltransferase n=1 Tax=Sphingorhabdus sp. TaxID=1902408 RepID=UPI0035B453F5
MFARTERLLLRPIWPEDASALHAAIADEGIVRNLARAPWPYTSDDAAWFAGFEHPQMFPNFMLMLRTDGAPKLIGSCGLGERDGEAELGYWIARPYWGQGFAAESARAVVDVARALGHRRLVSGHFIDNPASGRVLRKIGFRPLGRVERRYSAARRQDVGCVLFELPLVTGEAGPSDILPHSADIRMRAAIPAARAA